MTSRSTIAAAIGLLLAIPAPAAAHRLDEYLQAARVAIARDRVTLEIDLSPGISVAPAVLTLLDRDGDRRIAPLEAEAYGREVLRDAALEIDGRELALTLTRVEAPTPQEMADGVGTIQLEAHATAGSGTGRHRLVFRNGHQPAFSVYLVNALKPRAAGVEITAQTRDRQQRELAIDYEVMPEYARLVTVIFSGVGLIALVMFRRQR